ncbi:calcium:hydrogen antiporter [Dacryopinax primogenitus]|uniref:Vacuolar calcium ion transporter n=1 Tax=Dacryopinax primogenitus (strain DJM 731) TaxID=1858805 RepID=M5G4L8_DACPD|nr:calcium:hydrogen antiporter [Dacryopinax primogenitus]EJU00797.1 calcium:hydrogen antiporter [Dacryopinax primogenitus]
MAVPHADVGESTPLLPNGSVGTSAHRSFSDVLKGRGEPSWSTSLRFYLFSSWSNAVLIFVPLSAAAHYAQWDAGARFALSFMAIVPLAKLLGEATNQLSIKLGQTLGGLLNASFGNAVEIIVAIDALLHGQLRIVQTSLLGSILSNLLLVLGMSFFAQGVANGHGAEGTFGATAAQTSTSLMTLSCLTLVIPAAYHAAKFTGDDPLDPVRTVWQRDSLSGTYGRPLDGLLVISRGTAILLLLTYFAYLFFQFWTHKELFDEVKQQEGEDERASMSMISAGACLVAVTVITSFCADFLVASIEETAENYHIPKPFIGVVLLPLVSNAAEHVTSVWMATKSKMELVIAISIGSSIQIATFVIPLLVIIGWAVGQPLSLFFADFETIILFVSVLLVNLLIQDGKSNYMEGLMLIILYAVTALAFWVS